MKFKHVILTVLSFFVFYNCSFKSSVSPDKEDFVFVDENNDGVYDYDKILGDLSAPGVESPGKWQPRRYVNIVSEAIDSSGLEFYGEIYNHNLGSMESQYFRHFWPKNESSPNPIWAVVYVAGGGFNNSQQEWADEVAIDFAYRGWHSFAIKSLNGGLQDAPLYSAAMLEMLLMYIRTNADSFYIDPDKILVTGESAGDVTCELTYGKVDSLIPSQYLWGAESGEPNAVFVWSGMAYVDTVTTAPWGSVPPGTYQWDYTGVFSEPENHYVPYWKYHSKLDPIVPINWAIITGNSAVSGLDDAFMKQVEGNVHSYYQVYGWQLMVRIGNWVVPRFQ